jgi:NAD(P)-dependent dehydrogenase (short-subunit alcohol dehydrogenase family)
MTEKLALITGASRGLGFAMAEALSPDYQIIAVAKTTGGLEDLDDRIKAKGGQATLAPMDITNADAMAHLCRSIFDRWGNIDLWVHTAVHTPPLTPVASMDARDWDKSLSVNANATATLIPYVAPLLGDAGHAVFFEDVNVSDKFYGAYTATKTAQIALARAWQSETATTGPHVHIVQPQRMGTAVQARFHPGKPATEMVAPSDEAARIIAELNLVSL